MIHNNSSEQEPITGSSSVSKTPPKIKIDEKNVGLRITCLACTCVFIFIWISYSIKYFWYDPIMDEREEIDNKKVLIHHPVMDYSVDPPRINNCTHSEVCIYNCYYVRETLEEYKKPCEYKDYLSVIQVILEILLIIGLIGCLCGQK